MNAVFTGGRGSALYSFRTTDGSKQWKFSSPTKQWIVGGPVLDDDVLYMGTSDQHLVRAFDAATGTVLWETGVDQNIFAAPVYDDSCVYVVTGAAYADGGGSVYALDKRTGEKLAKLRLPDKVFSSPELQDGILYFGCSDTYIYAIQVDVLRNLPEFKPDPDANINLGDLDIGGTVDTSGWTLYNSGALSDSIQISLRGFYRNPTSDTSVVMLTPSCFRIQAQDSQKIDIQINTEKLEPGSYLYFITFTPQIGAQFVKNISFRVNDPSAVEDENPATADQFALHQNYPNPFNPSTVIRFTLAQTAHASLKVYNTLGQQVDKLINRTLDAGLHKVNWTPHDLCDGVYFYSLMVSDPNDESRIVKQDMKKMIYIK
ncbi:MAG: PQQ-binding-like beta-propeller repeat protein [candidate division KSB1 bacterium]|nr:PQQ-binding-like beta-propeller repeat protein [candidate division KSB1 bacterium]